MMEMNAFENSISLMDPRLLRPCAKAPSSTSFATRWGYLAANAIAAAQPCEMAKMAHRLKLSA
jgi:hypothetical protein